MKSSLLISALLCTVFSTTALADKNEDDFVKYVPVPDLVESIQKSGNHFLECNTKKKSLCILPTFKLPIKSGGMISNIKVYKGQIVTVIVEGSSSMTHPFNPSNSATSNSTQTNYTASCEISTSGVNKNSCKFYHNVCLNNPSYQNPYSCTINSGYLPYGTTSVNLSDKTVESFLSADELSTGRTHIRLFGIGDAKAPDGDTIIQGDRAVLYPVQTGLLELVIDGEKQAPAGDYDVTVIISKLKKVKHAGVKESEKVLTADETKTVNKECSPANGRYRTKEEADAATNKKQEVKK